MIPDDTLSFETRAAHCGTRMRVGDAISTVVPVVASSTFTHETVDDIHRALGPDGDGFAYSRNSNPTVAALERALADLEGVAEAVAFGSGMAALHAGFVAAGLESGDRIVAASDLYGVTRSLLNGFAQYDIETHFVNILDLQEVERALAETKARVLYFESISNPLLHVSDVRALATLARSARAVSIIDNTFATPYLLRPAELGVDLVVHSATKYVAGHGDVMAGYLASTASFGGRARAARSVYGGIMSPFDAWLVMRGLRTLPIRMERQCCTALEVAQWLQNQPWVTHVYYPGLAHHRQQDLSRSMFGGRYGAMIGFDVVGGRRAALDVIDGLNLIVSATSLGDVVSLVLYPQLSSHRSLDPVALANAGIGDGLIRLSVGLESATDLCRDLQQAAQRTG